MRPNNDGAAMGVQRYAARHAQAARARCGTPRQQSFMHERTPKAARPVEMKHSGAAPSRAHRTLSCNFTEIRAQYANSQENAKERTYGDTNKPAYELFGLTEQDIEPTEEELGQELRESHCVRCPGVAKIAAVRRHTQLKRDVPLVPADHVCPLRLPHPSSDSAAHPC